MLQEYDLDGLLEYNQGEKESNKRLGEEKIEEGIEHPNPEYIELSKEIKKLAEEEKKLLQHYGLVVKKGEELTAEELATKIKKLRKSKKKQRLEEVIKELEELRSKRASIDEREEVATGGYKRLRSGVKNITDAIKISVYEIESELFEMLEGCYANKEKDGRALIVGALEGSGSLRIENGKLIVKLEKQASPNRTRAIDEICKELNKRKARFPGTKLEIEFDTDRTG